MTTPPRPDDSPFHFARNRRWAGELLGLAVFGGIVCRRLLHLTHAFPLNRWPASMIAANLLPIFLIAALAFMALAAFGTRLTPRGLERYSLVGWRCVPWNEVRAWYVDSDTIVVATAVGDLRARHYFADANAVAARVEHHVTAAARPPLSVDESLALLNGRRNHFGLLVIAGVAAGCAAFLCVGPVCLSSLLGQPAVPCWRFAVAGLVLLAAMFAVGAVVAGATARLLPDGVTWVGWTGWRHVAWADVRAVEFPGVGIVLKTARGDVWLPEAFADRLTFAATVAKLRVASRGAAAGRGEGGDVDGTDTER